MSAAKKIVEAMKLSIAENRMVTVDLREASQLTGSGLDVGGRTYFDDAFVALRRANPFRMGTRNIKAPNSSAVQFVAKTGNALNQTNPWGYTQTPNSGTPGAATNFWVLPTRVLSASLPVRIAAMDDINGLENELVLDLGLEFAQQEAASIATNDDQAGSTTDATGATDGLRGLSTYLADTVSAFGTSGSQMTNGIHTIASVAVNSTAPTYAQIVAIANAFPSQYWSLPSNAWHMTPAFIQALRNLADEQGLPKFLELGEPNESGAVGSIFGWPVIPNPYLNALYPVYLANWNRFMTIADVEEMNIQMMEQTAPGFITMYAEKRMASTVRDPFAGVRGVD